MQTIDLLSVARCWPILLTGTPFRCRACQVLDGFTAPNRCLSGDNCGSRHPDHGCLRDLVDRLGTSSCTKELHWTQRLRYKTCCIQIALLCRLARRRLCRNTATSTSPLHRPFEAQIIMCRRVSCSTCKKPSWAGCGAHIDSALSGVPMEERCACKAKTQAEHNEKGGTGCSAM
jgi:hypothetical protein